MVFWVIGITPQMERNFITETGSTPGRLETMAALSASLQKPRELGKKTSLSCLINQACQQTSKKSG